MKKAALLFLSAMVFINSQIVFSQDRPGAAQFLEITGTVEIQESGSTAWTPATAGMRINKGAVISTSFKSTALVSLENSKLIIRPLTRLTLEEIVQREGGEEVSLYLRSGRVRAEVTPPAGRKTQFTVHSPSATASVRGTAFEFAPPHLKVDEGRVQYAGANGETLNVNRGEESYLDEAGNRLVPPFEINRTFFSPSLPELNNTGSGSSSSPMAAPGSVDTGVVWP